MSTQEAFPDPNRSPIPVKLSNESVNGFSRRMRSEMTRLTIIAILVFAAVVFFDLGDWLGLALEVQAYHVDDFIAAIFAVSFVLLAFLFRGWRDVRQEAIKRAVAVEETEQRSAINAQLSLMTSLLHACFALEEASTIISHFARQLFPNQAGTLYVFRSSRNLLELSMTWGENEDKETMFAPDQCWGLRQGQMYTALDSQRSIRCGHVHHDRPYACLPLMAHGEVLALVHVTPNPGAMSDREIPNTNYALLRVFIEPIALALSNLKLRDTLRQQSIRDPLTGLFNRRYLEEMLAIEIQRAKRNDSPFSVIMLDLDHFKLFNDTHGHEAGDAVLQIFGSFLQRHIRGGDIACRYGGEEFTLILPGTALEVGQQRAEQLCKEIRELNIDFKKQILGPLTLSVGVASFPNHGDRGEMVLQSADRALYQAKSDGRDRVVVALSDKSG
jgi:diguanylate cyclase (GGDEF)-like protein